MEDREGDDGGWEGAQWRMGKMAMEDGKEQDGEQLIKGSGVESGTTEGSGCGHSLNPEESSLSFNAVLHQ